MAGLVGFCGLRGGEGKGRALREAAVSFFSGGMGNALPVLTFNVGGGRRAPLGREEEELVRPNFGRFFNTELGGAGSGNCRRLVLPAVCTVPQTSQGEAVVDSNEAKTRTVGRRRHFRFHFAGQLQ